MCYLRRDKKQRDIPWTIHELKEVILNYMDPLTIQENEKTILGAIKSMGDKKLYDRVCEKYNLMTEYEDLEMNETLLGQVRMLFNRQIKKVNNSLKIRMFRQELKEFQGRYISFLPSKEENVYVIPEPKNGLTCVRSDMGTGKTYATAEYLKTQRGNMLSITDRRTLTGQHISSLKEQGVNLISYKASQEELRDARKIGIVFDSLVRKLVRLNKKYEIIILDECSSLIRHICMSPTFSNQREELYEYFRELLESAEKIIIIDADLEEKHIEFIMNLSGRKREDVRIYNNNYKIGRENIFNIFERNEKRVIEEIVKKAKETKETITVVCDERAMVTEVEKYLREGGIPDERLLVYTSKVGDINEISDDVSSKWAGNVVLYSPSVQTGVDNRNPTHVYGFFTNKSVTYREFYQMLQRSRKQLSCTLSIRANHYSPKYISVCGLDKEIDEYFERYKYLHEDYQERLGAYVRHKQFNKKLKELEKGEYYWMTLECMVDREKDLTYGGDKLIEYIKSKGYKVKIYEDYEKKHKKEGGKDVAEEFVKVMRMMKR